MIVHQCDFCKKITEDYTTYILPINEYEYIEKEGIKYGRIKKKIISQKIDLCTECSQTLANLYDPYLNG